MNESLLVKMLEHGNWANRQVIEACRALGDDRLDTVHSAPAGWSIRRMLVHLVGAQHGYLSLLTLPVGERRRETPDFARLQESAAASGEAIVTLARTLSDDFMGARLETGDGWHVEPWVVLLQVVNHATEHRAQIKSMLRALGVTPPDIDGWSYGEATQALIAAPK